MAEEAKNSAAAHAAEIEVLKRQIEEMKRAPRGTFRGHERGRACRGRFFCFGCFG